MSTNAIVDKSYVKDFSNTHHIKMEKKFQISVNNLLNLTNVTYLSQKKKHVKKVEYTVRKSCFQGRKFSEIQIRKEGDYVGRKERDIVASKMSDIIAIKMSELKAKKESNILRVEGVIYNEEK